MNHAIDTIIEGDALAELRKMPAESVDCCITSPPYYGLRDYGADGQIGLEESPEAYVARLVEVFREVRRVLKDEGTLWLNLGDSYASNWPCNRRNVVGAGSLPNGKREARPPRMGAGLKDKDLIGIPWMVAFALRADGWWLRSDIIWEKPNCMPESVTDRPTKSHEYLFLFAKSQKYFWDAEAIKEESITCDPRKPYTSKGAKELDGREIWHSGEKRESGDFTKRNKRTVWTIPTKPFKEAHFATFPEKLVEPCILAGTSEKGYCPVCGKAWVRQIETKHLYEIAAGMGNPSPKKRARQDVGLASSKSGLSSSKKTGYPQSPEVKTIGWLPSCSCNLDPVPAICLDPFFGAGTVGLVAKQLARIYIGIELNPAYVEIAKKRIAAIPASLARWTA